MNAQPRSLHSVAPADGFDQPVETVNGTGSQDHQVDDGGYDEVEVMQSDQLGAAQIHRLPLSDDTPGRQAGVLGVRVPVTTFDHRLPPPRNAEVEALWFSLSRDGFVPTSVVAVPPLSGDVARAFAMDIARTGAALTQRNVHVVNTVGLPPSDTVQALEELASVGNELVFVVTEAPSVNTSGMAVFRSTERALLVVGQDHSDVDEAKALVREIGAERIAGSVIIEPAPKSRRSRLRRRSS